MIIFTAIVKVLEKFVFCFIKAFIRALILLFIESIFFKMKKKNFCISIDYVIKYECKNC